MNGRKRIVDREREKERAMKERRERLIAVSYTHLVIKEREIKIFEINRGYEMLVQVLETERDDEIEREEYLNKTCLLYTSRCV